ncbi:unnamed protein product [Vitrella brassicaformis CCMP3155]|uniref:Tr-type G domain-containing protein n=1 Tax=Vitrella brassicaformis (strain CCMP3155) TaxID=1169540 RepID=A0A0G4FHX1_VITBC|nr:unnamed protein product [Vitrella brassicaformis CCMP3155]|mmetsp:Transcript_27284/g.78478  ORF Transcript_27284/g.78478 Transcript_27284/m.78478 type:complete len:574 (-) Transcript_27284:296-2017(-)|eukprot:CEM13058.1 unnamed protein product [Vitrella brassicaformis CCMP3155]
MSRRRVKNIDYDDDEYFDDYDDDGYDDYRPQQASSSRQHQAPKKPPKPAKQSSSAPSTQPASRKGSAIKSEPAKAPPLSKPKQNGSTGSGRPPLAPSMSVDEGILSRGGSDEKERVRAAEEGIMGGVEGEKPPEADARLLSLAPLNLVVIGHVDAGKSTLMGHLLVKMGAVTTKQIHRYQKESKEIGKGSFAFAWVLDEGEDERARGVTIDVCVKHFATKHKVVTVLDAPGHRDFVPNMLSGAVMADAALLVVDVTRFEAGFERGGQTKEHLQLVRALGIGQLIVAINKLDAVGWSEDRYRSVMDPLHGFIIGPEAGFKSSNVQYLPLSAFEGTNIVDNNCAELKAWWGEGATLVDLIDGLQTKGRGDSTGASGGPFKGCVSDVWRTGDKTSVSMKVDGGTLRNGQKVLILPSNETAIVKGLECRGASVPECRSGDYVDTALLNVEPHFVSVSSVLCDPSSPLPVVTSFTAQLLVFDLDIPIVKGQQVMMYLHTGVDSATIAALEAIVNKQTGERENKRPKALVKGMVAIVRLTVPKPVCLDCKGSGGVGTLSRVILRDRGKTIAAGLVLQPS